MSVTLFRLFVNKLRQNLPRHTVRTVLQTRTISAMDVAIETKDAAEKQTELVPSKKATRYNKRFMKRHWDDEKKSDGESAEKKPFERIKRKKMAMLLGYSGVDYYGMQRNPGVRTIEEDLLKALLEAKYINEDDFNTAQNTQFQRSSRTDKGVSAARQVVSLKLPLEVNIEEINKRLPDCIKVFGVKRVTNKFNSKSKCNARTYSYTTPSYVFEPSLVDDVAKKQYRIPSEMLERINSVLGVYKGTKCYHNFTEKKHFQDPSASRYMMDFSIDRVFVHTDMEFVVLTVKGQSFMLHQIRKMVGLMIAVIRGITDSTIMDKVFSKEKVMIPTAPGLGLVLDKVHYDRYDAKFKTTHDTLTWDEVEDTIQQFKLEYIYPNIVKGEIEDNNMGIWLEKLKLHSFEPSDDAPTKDAEEGGDDDDDDENDEDGDDDDDKPDDRNGMSKPSAKQAKIDEVTINTNDVETDKNIEIVDSVNTTSSGVVKAVDSSDNKVDKVVDSSDSKSDEQKLDSKEV